MADGRTQRDRPNRQERMALAAAKRRRAQRQKIVTSVVALGAVVAILFALLAGGDDKADVATSDSTTTTAAASDASSGPCVARTGDLPEGAPDVPVKEGPPPTELVSEDLKVGDGAEVTPGATVTVNYIVVSCSTGAIFDSSYKTGQPATFPLTQVIPGWTNGIPGMKVGGQRLLGIPPDQAYGPQGQPPVIGPNETLWFVVEVLDTKAA